MRWILLGPYRVCQKMARNLGAITFGLACGLFVVLILHWAFGFKEYQSLLQENSDQLSFIFHQIRGDALWLVCKIANSTKGITREQVTAMWSVWGWLLCVASFFWNLFVHYLFACLAVSLSCYYLKKSRTNKLVTVLDQCKDADLLGVDFVTGMRMEIKNYLDYFPFKIFGDSDSLRAMLVKLVQADCEQKESIIFIAPDNEKGLLEPILISIFCT